MYFLSLMYLKGSVRFAFPHQQQSWRHSLTSYTSNVCSDCISLIPFYSFPGLQHFKQDNRVSMGSDGNLYFSNAIQNDTRKDYCCFAAFPRIRTIVQKDAMAVVVKSCRFTKLSAWLYCTTVAHVFVMRSTTDVWGVRIQTDDADHCRPLCFFSEEFKDSICMFFQLLTVNCEMFCTAYQEAGLDLSCWSSGKLCCEGGLSNNCQWRQAITATMCYSFVCRSSEQRQWIWWQRWCQWVIKHSKAFTGIESKHASDYVNRQNS